MLTLLVKGDRFAASRAAAIRGVPWETVVESEHPIPRETLGKVPSAYIAQVMRWYCEKSEFLPSYGFVPGTLLFYSERD